MALASLGLSSIALIASFRALLAARRRIDQAEVRKHLTKLELEMVELLDNQEKLLTQVKRLYGRDAVRKHRNQRKTDGADQEESDAEWKARMNRQHALGGRPDG